MKKDTNGLVKSNSSIFIYVCKVNFVFYQVLVPNFEPTKEGERDIERLISGTKVKRKRTLALLSPCTPPPPPTQPLPHFLYLHPLPLPPHRKLSLLSSQLIMSRKFFSRRCHTLHSHLTFIIIWLTQQEQSLN